MTIIIRKKSKVEPLPEKIKNKIINFPIPKLPNNEKEIIHSKAPQPTRYFPDEKTDLTGLTFGKFKVIGAYAYKSRKWVVLCECGMHTIVDRSSLIKNHSNPKSIICKTCHKQQIWLKYEAMHICEGGSHI